MKVFKKLKFIVAMVATVATTITSVQLVHTENPALYPDMLPYTLYQDSKSQYVNSGYTSSGSMYYLSVSFTTGRFNLSKVKSVIAYNNGSRVMNPGGPIRQYDAQGRLIQSQVSNNGVSVTFGVNAAKQAGYDVSDCYFTSSISGGNADSAETKTGYFVVQITELMPQGPNFNGNLPNEKRRPF